MQTRFRLAPWAGALVAMAGGALGADDVAHLQDAWPGARVHREASGAVAIYGVPMGGAAGPEAAAAGWLQAWSGIFEAGELELTLEHVTPVRDGRFTAFLYSQTIDGLPVDGGLARILVRSAGAADGQGSVVYASGRLAPRPAAGFEAIRTAPADVIGAAQRMVSFAHLTEWTEPELVVFADRSGEDVVSRRAWRFGGYTHEPRHDAWEFFFDAASGRLLEARPGMHTTDVEGDAHGLATPGTKPDVATNPAAPAPMPHLQVEITGGAGATTDADGAFVIPHPGTAPVTVTGGVEGPFIAVDNLRGGELSDAVMVTPPGPAELLLNDAPAEFTTSQINAFIHGTRTHDLIKDRAPGFTALDMPLPTDVNYLDTCNAFFSSIGGLRIVFLQAGGGLGCVNSAYSTVVSHEYGHFIVHQLGLQQRAFGEGYGDSAAILLHDTGIIGENFYASGHIRNPETARRQVGACGGFHSCGEQLGGTWRWIRNNTGDRLGSVEGLDITRDLFVAWSMITLGGEGFGDDAIGERTAIEVLTVDDDDGMLENGTPHYDEIAAAFDRHGVDVPPVQLVEFTFPAGLPDLMTPSTATSFPVVVDAFTEEPAPGTGRLLVSIGGSFIPIPMMETAPNEYTAEIPGVAVFTQVDFYVEVQTTSGKTARSPAGAPGDFHSAIAGAELARLDFETADGWTVENVGVSDGAWDRGVPENWGRGDPLADFDGSGQCFLTDNDRFTSNSDVDGGPTRLISPIFDLSGVDEAQVSYARWFHSENSSGIPPADTMSVEFSDDGGVTWAPAETVPHTPSRWTLTKINISDVVPLTEEFRVRFVAVDNPNNSITEAGIDRFWILTDGGDACRADITGDGALDFFDFLGFQNLFAAGDLAADFTGDGVLDFFDFLAFQNEFAAGCP